MSNILETQGLGKRYRNGWALQECTLHLPKGRVVGLIGLNGAGKTTFMRLAAGLLIPDAGSLRVCGETPAPNSRAFLANIGFVPQEHGLYLDFSVREMLTLGRKLNKRWDETLVKRSLDRLHISPQHKVGKLSGGQRAQLALVLAMAKQPQLLLLDEPLANVDPLARREFMKMLMEMAVEQEVTILISSHILSDLENTCDYLIILSSSRVLLAEDSEQLLAMHKRVIVPGEHVALLTAQHVVIQSSQSGRSSSLLLRLNGPLVAEPNWQIKDITLEDITLAYLELPAESLAHVAPTKQEVF
jgi:ABC-2 type transport system ATP-binding protein